MATSSGTMTCTTTFHAASDGDTPERCVLRGTFLPADHPDVARFPDFFEPLPDSVQTAAPVERATRAPGEKRAAVKPPKKAAAKKPAAPPKAAPVEPAAVEPAAPTDS